MGKVKSTVDVKVLLDFANEQLANEYNSADHKEGICQMIEKVLHQANAYNGFQYIYWLKQGCSEWYAAGQPDFPEKDRYIYGNLGRFARVYYSVHKLTEAKVKNM